MNVVKVRCTRILRGGQRGRPEIGDHPSVRIGREYVVLAMSGRPIDGVAYMILRDDLPGARAVWASEMFEITSDLLPTSWRVRDNYGTGVSISLVPEPWLDGDFFERIDARDETAVRRFRDEVARLHEEEGLALDPWTA